MAYEESAQATARTKVFDGKVKGFAMRAYKFKQAVNVESTNAWKNYFYREEPAVLTGQDLNSIAGIPRGADFPRAAKSWDQVLAVILKYGLEGEILWEDILANDVDVQDRTLIRIAEGVTKYVDDAIWDGLTENRTTTLGNISSFSITAAYEWDTASAAIIDDLMHAKQLIGEANYPVDSLICFINHRNHRDIVKYLTDKGAQFPAISNDIASNGNAGNLAGITLIVSNSVTASYAMVCVPKRCGTWKELVPLQTDVTEDKFKKVTIRAVEEGTLQLTDPKAVVLIKNTRSA